MKTVKITLAVIVVAAIIVAIIRGCMPTKGIGEIQLPKNSYTKGIEQQIDSLKKMPESSFCEKFYNEIKFYIEEDFINNRFGNTQLENDQWKKNLSSNLYAAYTDKFIKQAFYVFNGSEWEEKKINFIRAEYKTLQNEGKQTNMLEQNSITDIKLNEIQNIFAKYDEITGFINSCKAFSLSKYTDINTSFPISDVETKISRSKEYLGNNLENDYVKSCKRLKTNLSEVPMILFKAHVIYLDNKINYFSGKYINCCSSLAEYNNNVYSIIDDEIGKLYIESYTGISIQDIEYEKLNDKWKLESTAAYNHYQ
jgi:hypothetical protein